MAAVGVYLHQQGFVDASGKRTLALISQQVTFPLFLFTKIIYCNQDWSIEKCPDVTATLRSSWILLIWPVFVVTAGLMVGQIIARITRTPLAQHKSVWAAIAFGNSTGLPITLLTVVHSNFPITTGLGLVDPTLFLSVYLLLYPVLQWGMGGWLLAPDEDRGEAPTSITDEEKERGLPSGESIEGHTYYTTIQERFSKNLLNQPNAEKYFHSRHLSSSDEGIYLSEANLVGVYTAAVHGEAAKEPSAASFTASINESVGLDYTQDRNEEHPLLSHEPSYSSTHQSTKAAAPKIALDESKEDPSLHQSDLMHTLKNIADRSLQPPVVGALLGFVFALIHPLRGAMVDIVDRGSHAPLQWFFDGLYSVGMAAVPINMLILGCNLSSSYNQYTGKAKRSNKRGLFSYPTLLGIVLGKMVAMPIIGICAALFLRTFVLEIPEGMAPSFYLVLMIVFLTVSRGSYHPYASVCLFAYKCLYSHFCLRPRH